MSIRSGYAKKLIDGGAYRIGHLVSNFNLHLVSTDDLKEKSGRRMICPTAVHLGRLSALGAMREMYSSCDLKLSTSNCSNVSSNSRKPMRCPPLRFAPFRALVLDYYTPSAPLNL